MNVIAKFRKGSGRQQGAITIFITMVLLVLITLAVLAAFSMSTTNLRAVGNVQLRSEAQAAASYVIEQTLGSDFTVAPAAVVGIEVNMLNNPLSPARYLVDLAAPVCVRATVASTSSASSVTLPGLIVAGAWDTVWELDATATDPASGAQVRVVQGVRVLLSDANKNARCPDV
tara:strand:- start:12179 stop:12697 length:519 start_codon:yes stop_codon:yes gene_type:complete